MESLITMNQNPSGLSRRRNQRGIALIIVLACLIILSVLTLAFISSVKTDMVSSKSYSDNNTSRILAETSVNIVMSQIRQATSGTGTAWASQPGMIRTFDASGGLVNAYKLYSSGTMTVAQVVPSAEAAALAGWSSKPALFTDLNEVGRDSTGTKVYAIAQPPDGSAEGYSVTGAPDVTPEQPVPMPASWLYVLQDGTLIAPTGSGTTATVAGASTDNPIIGRIAFWTDDESCKVNINTAGVGMASTGIGSSAPYLSTEYNTFWDVPRFSTPTEMNFGWSPPAQREYQRYPGHPGTVSLKEVFPGKTAQELLKFAPRYAYAGSLGGQKSWDLTGEISRAELQDRLYSSIDELLFSSTTSPRALQLTRGEAQAAQFFLTSSSRAPELNLFGQPRVSIWPIYNSAIATDNNHHTATDRLFAFCSTSNGHPYYFLRQNATSATNDIGLSRNLAMLNYLDRLTGKAIPGFGGDFKTKYPNDSRQILTEIFDYIRSTNTQDSLLPGGYTYGDGQAVNPNWFACIPTVGYERGKGQVTPSRHPTWNTQGFGHFWRVSEVALQFVGLGDGARPSATPNPAPAIPVPLGQIQNSYISTDGTIATTGTNIGVPPNDYRAVQAFLHISFINPAQSRSDGSSRMWIEIDGLDSLTVFDDVNKVSKLLFGPGTRTMLNGTNTSGDPIGTGGWLGHMSFSSQLVMGGYERYIGPSGVNPHSFNPYFSSIVSLPIDRPLIMSAGPITIRLYDISAGPNLTTNTNPIVRPSNANLVQTYTVRFENTTVLPLPGLTLYPIIGKGPGGADNALDAFGRHTKDRWYLPHYGNGFDNAKALIDTVGLKPAEGGDVVQSMVLSTGWSDARLLARNVVPTQAFTTAPGYGASHMAHNLFYGGSVPVTGHPGNFGTLVPGISGANYANAGGQASLVTGYPSVPPGFAGTSTWDWDNGIGNYQDGPWINKPDEGWSTRVSGDAPYFSNDGAVKPPSGPLFSPNRQVSSPGMFGSLSTGISPDGTPTPWQTLLFRPGPSGHVGSNDPKDHLFMDLFWMPTVEPYAISEPFSTAGKINLNQQLMPYTYITRYTGLRAALAGEKAAVMPKSRVSTYKSLGNMAGTVAGDTFQSRRPLNLSATNGTLRQFKERFDAGDIFRSPSEICDIFLVPQGYTWGSDSAARAAWYGDDFALVGDNTRERPYANLYAKLTTKSNTYKVHYRVQSLQKRTNSNQTLWEEGKDKVTGEKRGATLLERYIDPAANIGDFADSGLSNTSLESYYKFRIINSTEFPP